MKAYLSAILLIPALIACSSSRPTPATKDASLSHREVSKAVAVARHEIAKQGGSVYSVSATARRGVIKSTSNIGHPCTSGRVLTIKLIGKFHTVTTGRPVLPGQPTPDFTVRAVGIDADAKTGVACLIGVETAENGEPKPLLNGIELCGSDLRGLPCVKPPKASD